MLNRLQLNLAGPASACHAAAAARIVEFLVHNAANGEHGGGLANNALRMIHCNLVPTFNRGMGPPAPKRVWDGQVGARLGVQRQLWRRLGLQASWLAHTTADCVFQPIHTCSVVAHKQCTQLNPELFALAHIACLSSAVHC
jgi:hypothetical protein